MRFVSPHNMDDKIGIPYPALDVYKADEDQFDKEEWFVTVDICVEIPLAACQLFLRECSKTAERAHWEGLIWQKHSTLDMWDLVSRKFHDYKNGSKRRTYGTVSLKNLFGDTPERGEGYSASVCKNPKAIKVENTHLDLGSFPTLDEAMNMAELSFKKTQYFF